MSEMLPTGTVTVLIADVEGSTRLWENQPEEMTAAVAQLDRSLSDVIVAHGGVRPVEQREHDSFVVVFRRASDAVACALELQRAPLGPIRLRIGVHTGECSYLTRATTSARPSTAPRGCAIWRTAARPFVRHDKRFGGRPAAGRYVVDRSRHPSVARSAAARARRAALSPATCATSSHRCAHRKPFLLRIFRHSSPVSLDAKPKWTNCAGSSRTTGLSL